MKRLIYFAPFLILIVLIVVAPRIVRINHIECKSELGVCSDYLKQNLEKAEGKTILDSKNYIKNLFAKEIKIIKYSFKFKLPDKLEVYVIEKKPIVAIGKPDNPSFILIDSNGEVISIEKETNLPTILTGSDFTDKKEVPVSLSFAANLLYDLNLVYEAKIGRIVDGSLQVVEVDGKTVIFPLEGDRQVLIGALKVILSGLHREGQVNTIKIIDLRFKNPVLR